MATYAIGDVQGCDDELGELLRKIHFQPDRDTLWFTGDIVNRGPRSLEALRRVHALRDNATVVLGNHDLHLLALARSQADRFKRGDTLDAILDASDRETLLDWLQSRPLLHHDSALEVTMVHAGLPPQWDLDAARSAAREVENALRRDAPSVYGHMYGDGPDRWNPALKGYDRLRFAINCFTRLRYCSADGRINVKLKDAPDDVKAPWMPWFRVPGRASAGMRIVCGHWSTLGWNVENNVHSLDTGCVWGGSLTALRLDVDDKPVSIACRSHREPGKHS